MLSGVSMVDLIMAMDLASRVAGRPIVSPFMADAYASAASPMLLFVAFVIAAPLCEELLFRGFLFGGLRACGTRLWVVVAVVSFVFASIHTQYDWFDGTAVLLVAFALIGARVHSGSFGAKHLHAQPHECDCLYSSGAIDLMRAIALSTARVSFDACTIERVPVQVEESRDRWWLWWVPTPHLDNSASTQFELTV